VKEISVAPILELDSGKKKIGNVADKFEFSNKDIIKNLGGVSWWRFEENANDEIGGNHGEEFGGVSYVDSDSLNINSEITISLWIKTSENSDWRNILHNKGDCHINQRGYMVTSQYGKIGISAYSCHWLPYSNTINDEEWRHFIFIIDGASWKVYEGGNLNSEESNSNVPYATGEKLLLAQSNIDFTLDELIIFNHALSEEQVKALYELDLS